MINDVPRFNIMAKHCMDHRVKSMVQFDIINMTKDEWFKVDISRIITVLNHKQKVIRMRFCEGQIECVGKNVMSILGSKELQWEEISNGSQSRVFFYYYFYCVIKGYSGKDNTQLGDIDQKMQ